MSTNNNSNSLQEVEEMLLRDIREAMSGLSFGNAAEQNLRAERLDHLLAATLKTVELRSLLEKRERRRQPPTPVKRTGPDHY